MTIAYVLLTTEGGSKREVLNEIQSIPEVKEAYTLYGVYDLLIKIKSDDQVVLRDRIIRRIRHLDKVRSILTMIVLPDDVRAREEI